MTPNVEALYQAALALPEDERAEHVDLFLDSQLPDAPSQLHPAWRGELLRRAAQIDLGEVKPVPLEEVRRQAWEALDQEDAPPNG
jgi:putative addiction module component (TIGR02574 family)